MSKIYYNCPNCSKRFQSDSEKSGLEVKCTQCSHPFNIPDKSTFSPGYIPAEPQNNITNISSNYDKYPFLIIYCFLIGMSSGFLVIIAVIAFFVQLDSPRGPDVQSLILLIGFGLGGFASAGLIRVLMDIEKNTRLTAENTRKDT